MRVASVEIVEDRTEKSRCDEGFLKVSRLILRNRYENGTLSEAYPCDVVSRPGSDAVVAILYEIGPDRKVRVLLREGLRAPIYLRRLRKFIHPDARTYTAIHELVAGLLEKRDGEGESALRRRASAESAEEAGIELPPERFTILGGETFASPGTSDEKLFYAAAAVKLDAAGDAPGDGSVMEQAARLVRMELGEAIALCRQGVIPDMKTELGLLRLAEHLDYLPHFGCFVSDLPGEFRKRYRRRGIEPRSGAGEGR
jgi:ADP-ribose pyrophosphatase